eukprot:TRINITY_DN27523_c0_g1_i2.p1 TRINITY_DN27523_c0_g1~~TRINITY_DN27523_c0_g1_i2.p1  ORF type:complete len:373 (+),score=49.29 TRINITY_DN27523_c0_g1_i2:140-1258(+)
MSELRDASMSGFLFSDGSDTLSSSPWASWRTPKPLNLAAYQAASDLWLSKLACGDGHHDACASSWTVPSQIIDCQQLFCDDTGTAMSINGCSDLSQDQFSVDTKDLSQLSTRATSWASTSPPTTPRASIVSSSTPPPPPRRCRYREGGASLEEVCLDYWVWMGKCRDQRDDNYIMHAVIHHRVSDLRILLEGGVTDKLDLHRSGQRPLHAAITYCRRGGDSGYEMVQLLLQHGANPGLLPGDKQAPLMHALSTFSPAALLLINGGADVMQLGEFDFTALHVLTMAYSRLDKTMNTDYQDWLKRIAKSLIGKGVSPLQVDAFGNTCKDYCRDAELRGWLENIERSHWASRLQLTCGRILRRDLQPRLLSFLSA